MLKTVECFQQRFIPGAGAHWSALLDPKISIFGVLLSILFFTLHLADDIIRRLGPGTLTNLSALPTFVFWLYGTLALAERRSGYIITLLGGLFALVVPLAHMRGKGVGVASGLANSSGHFFFV